MLKLINVDIDGVVADLAAVWYPWIAKEFGDHLTREKVTDWDITKFCPNGGLKILDFLKLPNLYDEVPVIPGAVEVVRKWQEQGRTVRFISSHPIEGMKSKGDWLQRNFPFISRKNLVMGDGIDKSHFHGEVLIDDANHNLKDFPGFKLLFDYPYNRTGDEYGHIRVHDWAEIDRVVGELDQNKDLRWRAYFMRLAREVARRGSCDRAQVGCVLVYNKRVIATGYNGAVTKDDHCSDAGHLMRNGHCVRTIHAEENSLVQAAAHGIAVSGASAYVTHFPCWGCFKKLINAGIVQIFYNYAYRPDELVVDYASKHGVGLFPLPC